MLSPTERTQGLLATDILRSMSEQLEARRKEEDERAGIRHKVDPLVEARISVSEEARRSREKIASAMFSHESVSINELKMKIADQLAEKLGFDTDKSRSYQRLGKLIEDLVSKMDVMARRELEQAVGLDELGVSLTTFVSALIDPGGDGNERLVSTLEKTAGRGGVTEAGHRVLTRLKDVADPKTVEEVQVQEEIRDPARIEDAVGKAERLDSLRAAEVSEKLDQVGDLREAITAREKTKGDGEAVLSDADLLTIVAVRESAGSAGDVQELTEEPGGEVSSGETDATMHAADEERRPGDTSVIRIEDGVYQLLWMPAA